ncbi:hypothetical protein [uncultured Methylobacterium sp.]|jgi:hypothetical protein|uniref:hypothetical protein n=1 Tax=uncultured Methylobacterium sp. TaxID=157278 RepID=UPI002620B527|nr:hypothetical protein [uncultured Methylobacterium sp.]
MQSLVIAETQAHARAVIHWLGLDPTTWRPITYGTPLPDLCLNVLIVRPLTGIREEQGDWFIETVIPRMAGTADVVPKGWRPEAEEPVHPTVTENALWA